MTKAADYGTVDYKGTTYKLIDHAELTNRVFHGWFGDSPIGETYTSEWSSPSVGPDGERYLVTWQFQQIKGSEEEPDMLNWDDVFSVSAL